MQQSLWYKNLYYVYCYSKWDYTVIKYIFSLMSKLHIIYNWLIKLGYALFLTFRFIDRRIRTGPLFHLSWVVSTHSPTVLAWTGWRAWVSAGRPECSLACAWYCEDYSRVMVFLGSWWCFSWLHGVHGYCFVHAAVPPDGICELCWNCVFVSRLSSWHCLARVEVGNLV